MKIESVDTRIGLVENITPGQWVILVWGFAWRGVCISSLALIFSYLSGGMVGLLGTIIARSLNVESEAYLPILHNVSITLGMFISIGSFILYVQWLVRSRFGNLKLAVTKTDER